MNSSLEYILKLKDLLSPAMRAAAGAADTAGSKIEKDFAGIHGAARRAGAAVGDVGHKVDALGRKRDGLGRFVKQFDDATKSARRFDNELDKIGGSGGKGGMLGAFVGGNLIAGAISQAGSMVIDGVKETYSKGLQMGSMRSALNATTGGQGAEAMAQTDTISNKYGLNYEASLEGVKTLTGGLKSMNMPLAEQMKIFEGVSTGIAAMKLGAEESKGAMLALGQMASKGTVSAEELRGQLGERIPGAFGIAAKAMGVTESALNGMLQRGEIASKDFLPAFAKQMQETFGAEAMAAANGPAALQARFDNAIFKMKASIGEGLMPMITPVLESLTGLATTILPYIQQGIDWLVTGFRNINVDSGMWGEYMAIIKSYASTLWNTVKGLWGNIWSILSAVGQWVGQSELLKDIFWVIGKVANGLLWVVGKIGDGIAWIWNNIIQPILNGIETAYSAIKGFFGGSKEATVKVEGPAKVVNLPGLPPEYMPKDKEGYNPITGNTGNAPIGGAGGTKDKGAGVARAEAVNSGGQRTITINIGKQIESLNIHVADAGATSDEIENAVRESMKRVLYSLNNVAA